MLIGAGDDGYLAWAGVWTLACFVPLALLVLVQDAGLVWLWWAFDVFLVARLVTLVVRWRGEAWLVTGAALPRRHRRISLAERWSVADRAVDDLAEQVGVAVVPGVLLDHVQHEGPDVDGLLGAVAVPGDERVVEVVRRPAPRGRPRPRRA